MEFLYKSSLMFLLLIVLSCTQKSNWKIEFCTEIDDTGCKNESNFFEQNVRVYVTLESKNFIEEQMIVGNIYRMLDGSYEDYLGTKNFTIEPNTYKIKHNIPFDELGGAGPHLIEFTREDGTLLISKELFIK